MSPSVATVRYAFDDAEFRRAAALHFRVEFGLVPLLASVLGLAIFVVVGWAIVQAPEQVTLLGLALAVATSTTLLSLRPLFVWRASARFRRSLVRGAVIEQSFLPDRLVQKCDGALHKEVLWALVRRVVLSPEGALVYTGPRAFHWIPWTRVVLPTGDEVAAAEKASPSVELVRSAAELAEFLEERGGYIIRVP